jgi:hypothetical protein
MAEGATYSPVVAPIAPIAGLTVQVTDVLEVPVTLALNLCNSEAPRVTEVGLTETRTTGFRKTEDVADFVGSATLVAITVTLCAALIDGGAVYSPPTTVPTPGGFSDQLTLVFVAPAT